MTGNIVAGLGLGFIIAAITTPVGVSGAVFLLPAQLSLLKVPTPAVTPTNLLFNVVAVPGALLRHRRNGLHSPLTRPLLTGTIPGVAVGAVIRVFVIPGPTVFRVVVAALLLPLGVWMLARRQPAARRTTLRNTAALIALGAAAGVIGGIYGIGGGSVIAPVLVGAGYAITDTAPAALIATFVTSSTGAATYALIDVSGHHQAGPHWALGIACGLGGLIGGYLGATLTPLVPAATLRRLVGALAISLAAAYAGAAADHYAIHGAS